MINDHPILNEAIVDLDPFPEGEPFTDINKVIYYSSPL
jgi:hypothetical protein